MAGPTDTEILEAGRALRAGELVAMPTETVYGLACDATNSDAIRRVFAVKRRPPSNPLIVHVDSLAMARSCASEWPALAERLAAAFWPGPLTLVVPRHERIPDLITAGLDAVALRMPSHPVALALIRAAGVPIAAPSANPYMAVSPTSAEHVRQGLGQAVKWILDAGPTQVGLESTVVDLTVSPPRMLRPGGVSLAALRELLPDLVLVSGSEPAQPLPSPGQAPRHYAPDAPLGVLATDALWHDLALAQRHGRHCAVIHYSPCPDEFKGPLIVRLAADPEGYAKAFYAALHTLSAAHPDQILVEAPPPTDPWLAVRDRLNRASQPL
jgi:L-threonylcarbamoyladenylate synthase